MSRIGRMPIALPSSVDVTIDGRQLAVKGPKGSLRAHAASGHKITGRTASIVVARPTSRRPTSSSTA